MPSIRASHLRNYDFSRTPEFTHWMVAELCSRCIHAVRVHVSGDFYATEYVRKWYDICLRLPRVTFLAYTRSWRSPEMLPDLIRLAALRNMSLWWSIDRETGPAPCIRGIRRAYMAIDDADASTAPDDCDLVFRADTATEMKKANGIQVCPPENGVKTKVKITCTTCGICLKQKLPRWEQDLSHYLPSKDLELTAPA